MNNCHLSIPEAAPAARINSIRARTTRYTRSNRGFSSRFASDNKSSRLVRSPGRVSFAIRQQPLSFPHPGSLGHQAYYRLHRIIGRGRAQVAGQTDYRGRRRSSGGMDAPRKSCWGGKRTHGAVPHVCPGSVCPQRDSNPCLHPERMTTLAASRWGFAKFAATEPGPRPRIQPAASSYPGGAASLSRTRPPRTPTYAAPSGPSVTGA